jgi:hypothetical protein
MSGTNIMQLRQQVANLLAELADMYKEKYNLFLTADTCEHL